MLTLGAITTDNVGDDNGLRVTDGSVDGRRRVGFRDFKLTRAAAAAE